METKDISELIGIPNVILSKDGRVWRDCKEKKFSVDKMGYPVYTFSVNNKTKNFHLHRLLLQAFVRLPIEKEQCLHINGIKKDFRLENLRWGTAKENIADSINHGTFPMGEKHPKSKLTNNDIHDIRNLRRIKNSPTNKQMSIYYVVRPSTIGKIIRNETYRSI